MGGFGSNGDGRDSVSVWGDLRFSARRHEDDSGREDWDADMLSRQYSPRMSDPSLNGTARLDMAVVDLAFSCCLVGGNGNEC